MKALFLTVLMTGILATTASATPRIMAKSSYYPATGGSVLLASDSTQYTYPAAPVAAFPYYSSGVNYTHSTGSWAPSYKDDYTYDTQGYLTRQTHDQWNAALAAYTHFSRWSYSNNTTGQPTDQVNELWNTGSAAFANSQHYTYTYDASGRLAVTVLQVWATYITPAAWVNSTRVTKTYNAQGSVTMQTTEAWNSSTSAWANNDRTTNTYDATGLHQTAYLYEGWDNTINSYYNVYRRTITPDAAGRPLISLYDTYNRTAATWTPTNRLSYFYATSGSSDTVVVEQWNASLARLDSTMRQDDTYNAYHQPVTLSYLSRVNGGWGIGANAARYNYYYEDVPTAVSGISAGKLSFMPAPNPATDVLHIQLAGAASEPCAARLLDMQGRVYRQLVFAGEKTEISVADLPAGNYIISVSSAAGAGEAQMVTIVH